MEGDSIQRDLDCVAMTKHIPKRGDYVWLVEGGWAFAVARVAEVRVDYVMCVEPERGSIAVPYTHFRRGAQKKLEKEFKETELWINAQRVLDRLLWCSTCNDEGTIMVGQNRSVPCPDCKKGEELFA